MQFQSSSPHPLLEDTEDPDPPRHKLPHTDDYDQVNLDDLDDVELNPHDRFSHSSPSSRSHSSSSSFLIDPKLCFVLSVILLAALVTWLAFLSLIQFRLSHDDPQPPQPSPALAYPAYPGIVPDAAQRFHAQFLGLPDPANIRTWLQYYTQTPHLAGTPEDAIQANWTRDKWASWGVAASLSQYQVLRTLPLERSVSLSAPFRAALSLAERTDYDAFSADPRVVPPFHGYAPSGTALGRPLVYANFCALQDFQLLQQRQVNLTGAVVLCRYKRLFRGIKVQLAQQHGAAAVLIYSDPQQDGALRGPVYPNGPWRPSSAVERGSVQFLSIYSGDPLTPSRPSLPGVQRIDIAEANIPKIPSLPISADDALPLLRALAFSSSDSTSSSDSDSTSSFSPRAPDDWQGGFTPQQLQSDGYHIGPGSAVVDFHYVAQTEDRVDIWNVVGRIPGAQEPDRWVLIGNHRDAWTFGAADPNSGTAPLLEILRSFSLLRSSGWQPRRTVLACSWDMEEYGLVGSTEWAEEHAAELSEKAVAYVNVDEGVTGPSLSVAASPALAGLVRAAARRVAFAGGDGSVSLYDEWLRRSGAGEGQAALRNETAVDVPGSGSDFTPFLQHLGIASISMELFGAYGVYHSVNDDFRWMEMFGDPQFANGKAIAQLWGLVTLVLADATILPFDHRETAQFLSVQYDAVVRLAAQHFASGAVDFVPLQSAISHFSAAAYAMHTAITEAPSLSEAQIRAINDKLCKVERYFLAPEGLAGRPFYKHLLYAPGLYLGYDASVFPGLSEAILNEDLALAQIESNRLASFILSAALFLSD